VTYAKVTGNLTATVGKDKWDMHILVNMYRPPAESNFHEEHGKDQKSIIVEDYNWHMGYINNGDRMASSYSIRQRTWEWKKNIFNLFNLTIWHSYIILSSCGITTDHRKFVWFWFRIC
jgi:hypothetical protein